MIKLIFGLKNWLWKLNVLYFLLPSIMFPYDLRVIKKSLWVVLFGCKKLLSFNCHTMKFQNCHHTNKMSEKICWLSIFGLYVIILRSETLLFMTFWPHLSGSDVHIFHFCLIYCQKKFFQLIHLLTNPNCVINTKNQNV